MDECDEVVEDAKRSALSPKLIWVVGVDDDVVLLLHEFTSFVRHDVIGEWV